jgi:hypothetical protein
MEFDTKSRKSCLTEQNTEKKGTCHKLATHPETLAGASFVIAPMVVVRWLSVFLGWQEVYLPI